MWRGRYSSGIRHFFNYIDLYTHKQLVCIACVCAGTSGESGVELEHFFRRHISELPMPSRLWQRSLDGVRRSRHARSAPYETTRKRHAEESDEAWTHDKFDEDSLGRDPSTRRRRTAWSGDVGYSKDHGRGDREMKGIRYGTKVTIEGLHYDVSEAELHDLLVQVGPVAKGPLLQVRSTLWSGIHV